MESQNGQLVVRSTVIRVRKVGFGVPAIFLKLEKLKNSFELQLKYIITF